MIRPKGKARNIAEMILKGKGVKLMDSKRKEKMKLDVPYSKK